MSNFRPTKDALTYERRANGQSQPLGNRHAGTCRLAMFEISVAYPNDSQSVGRTWMVLAETEDDARALVPAGQSILTVETVGESVRATGENRIIGWYGPHVAQPASETEELEHPCAGPYPTD